MGTEEKNVEIVVRPPITEFVEIVTLEKGDRFENDFCAGVVEHVINRGSSKSVEVIFDGHTVPQSIAPSLRVRKVATPSVEPEPTPEPIAEPTPAPAPVEMIVADNSPPVIVTPAPPVVVVKPIVLKTATAAPAPAPAPVKIVPVQPVKVVPIVVKVPTGSAPVPQPRVARVAPKPGGPLPVCSFNVTPKHDDIPSTATAGLLIEHGILHSWTKESIFHALGVKFAASKAARDFKSCCQQINFYRAKLRGEARLA